jgi:uncharacterized membrane protein
MATYESFAGADEAKPVYPEIRKIGLGDVLDSLRRGLDDFWDHPSHYVFLGLIYPVIGVVLGMWATGANALPLFFPLLSGFALIGPLAAIGLYAISRRRERGEDSSWSQAFEVLRSPALPSIAALGVILLAVFMLWLIVAQGLYATLFGPGQPTAINDFLGRVFSTPEGWNLIVFGNAIGAVFAIVVLATTVVAFPLLLDRNVGVLAAIQTSVRATLRNPIPVLFWGLIVAVALILGSVPLLIGLAIVLPVLGHSTWHLYRKLVVPNPGPLPQRPPRRRHGRRYAADFPAVLIPWYHEGEEERTE